MSETAHILIVEDDRFVQKALDAYLKGEGYKVSVAGDGQAMRRVVERDKVDVVIMDLRLPGEDGFQLTRYLRESHSVGIIMLTSKNEAVDRVVGLEIGADDYVTKPFDERELLARIRSLLRRMEGHRPEAAPAPGQVVIFAGWRFDPTVRTLVADDDKPVELTSSEFNLLAVLLAAPGKVLSRDHLMNAVYKRNWQPMDRSIDVLVTRLRRKLESRGQPEMIKTVRGSGYTFSVKIEPASGEPTPG